MTLALLIAAVGGAWADGTVYNSSVDVHTLQPDDILIEGAAITGITSSYGPKIVGYYMQSEDNEHYSKYNSPRALAGSDAQVTLLAGGVIEYLRTSSRYTYTPCDAEYNPLNAWIVTQIEDVGSGSYRVQITAYQYEPAIELKPDETGKNWSLADMPASNIELQVEYFAESNLFLGKEALADMANIAVKNGEATVEFDKDGKSTATVTEGNTVTAKFTGKKVLGMKVAKAAGKTVDLSTYSGTSYEVTEDVTFTGTTNNEIAILYKGDDYEVTLDNVNAPKCFIAAQDD